MKKKLFMMVILGALLISCGKGFEQSYQDVAGINPEANEVIEFKFLKGKNLTSSFTQEVYTGVINGNQITIAMPSQIPKSALIATFAITGSKALVNNNSQANSVSSNDFTLPKTYQIISISGKIKEYTVSIIPDYEMETPFVITSVNCSGNLWGITFDSAGTMYLSQNKNSDNRILPIDINGVDLSAGSPAVTHTEARGIAIYNGKVFVTHYYGTNDYGVTHDPIIWGNPILAFFQLLNTTVVNGVVFDSFGNIYYSSNNSVCKKTYAQTALDYEVGSNCISGFTNPYGIAVSTSGNSYASATINTYVADFGHNRVMVYNKNGVQVGLPWPINSPTAITIDNDGFVYVVSSGVTPFINKYDPSGNLISKFASGQFTSSYGIAVGLNGTVYLTDYNYYSDWNKRIVFKFKKN